MMSLVSVEARAQAPASIQQPYPSVLSQPVLFVINALRRRKWLILAIVALSTAVSIAILQQIPPRYTATVMLTVEGTSVVPPGIPITQEASVTLEKINTLMEILASEAMAREVVQRLDLKNDPEFNPYLEEQDVSPGLDADAIEMVVAQVVMSGVSVVSTPSSYVVHFSFESVDPQKAAKIANTFAEAFLDLQLESKFKASQQTAAWFNQRIDELRESVRSAGERVEAYKEQAKLHEVAGETITSQQLVEVNRQLIEARAARAQAEARLRQINQLVSAGDVESAPEVLSSPLIFALRQQETDLERRLGEAAELYGERHPKMIALTAERRDLRSRISTEIRRIVSALSNEANVARSREATLQRTLSELEAKVEEAAKAQVKLAELQREADTERVVLEAFLQRTTETVGQEELQKPDARLFAAAHPPVLPSSPVEILYLGLAITWGLALGMLIALALEYFERKINSERDVESVTGTQPLALVPEVSGWIGRRHLDVHRLTRDPQTPYSDAINSVRGGLRFIRSAGRVPSVIMVSSAASGEGKSTFAASLAMAAARSGQSVVLIDADLRRPGVARTFKVKPRATVVDVLMGRESLDDALIRVEQGRLHLLCSRAPQDTISPVDVFEKAALETLLDLLRSRFELIVVDTPPVNAVSDALLFAGYVDVVLFLIRWRHTNSEIVMSSIKQLYDAGAPCVRCVLSRINVQRYRLYGTKDYSYYKQVNVG